MYKLIFVAILSLAIVGCDFRKEAPNNEVSINLDAVKVENAIAVDAVNSDAVDSVVIGENDLPIHGVISQEKLDQYFPGVADTIQELRYLFSEKLNIHPGRGILTSILHNSGAFDQMILCTHDETFTLIDHFYIGKATDFDKSSHTIEYEVVGANSLSVEEVDWGYVKKGEEFEIDSIAYEGYTLSVNDKGEITKE